MSEPGFWRDRVNGKWYLTDAHGDVYEMELTQIPGDPFRCIPFERNKRAFEEYDERRSRPRITVTREEMEAARDSEPGSNWRKAIKGE